MPRYDVKCPVHGVHEIVRPMRGGEPLRCEAEVDCAETVARHFAPGCFAGARIDDMENAGSERTDASRGFNLGLPGVTENGKYRARHSSEVGSNRQAREIARQHNLTPVDGGRYRSR